MSDPTTDTLRRTMQAIVATAPEAPDLETERERAPARRPRPLLVMASAFAFVLLVGAVTSLVLEGNDRGTVPSGGEGAGTAATTSVAPTPQTAKAEMEQAVEQLQSYSDPITDQLSLGLYSGPVPEFDVVTLGDEMPLVNAYDGASALPVIPDVFDGPSDAIVYIGSIDGVDGFVYGVDTDGGTTEVCQSATWTQRDATMTACFTLDEPGLSKSVGMADTAADGIAINVTVLGDAVSIVAVELPSGQRYWQRPVAGSAMFVTSEPDALGGVMITTYDKFGVVLATDQINPNA